MPDRRCKPERGFNRESRAVLGGGHDLGDEKPAARCKPHADNKAA